MPLTILRGDQQVPRTALSDRTTAVIGFGNQGAAHALNLRDSGFRVVVGARDGVGATAARATGLAVEPIGRAAAAADLVVIALPDEVQPEVVRSEIAANLRSGSTLGFLTGYCVHFK